MIRRACEPFSDGADIWRRTLCMSSAEMRFNAFQTALFPTCVNALRNVIVVNSVVGGTRISPEVAF